MSEFRNYRWNLKFYIMYRNLCFHFMNCWWSDSVLACSRLRDSRVRAQRKRNGRKLGRVLVRAAAPPPPSFPISRTHIFVHLLLTLHPHYLRAWNKLGMFRNFVVRFLIIRFGRNPRVSHIPANSYLASVSPIPFLFSLPPNPTPFLTPTSNALNYPAFLATKLRQVTHFARLQSPLLYL